MFDFVRDSAACASTTGIPDVVRDMEYVHPLVFLEETWIDRVSQKHLTSESRVFRDFMRCGQSFGDKLAGVSRDLHMIFEPGQTALSESGLRSFETWITLFRQNAAFILVTHPFAKSVEIRLMDVMKKHGVPAKDLDQALLDLSISRKSNAAEEENFDLFFIQSRLSRPDFDLDAALKEHTEKHAYIKYRDPFTGGYSIDYFRERLKTKLELPNYFQPYADIIAKFDAGEKELVDLQEEFVFYRTYRTERLYEAMYYLERSLSVLENAHGFAPHELSHYSKNELIRFLESGQRVDPGLVEDRRRGFAFLVHEGSLSVLTGKALQQWNSGRAVEKISRESQVRGLIAFRGSVTGEARIVMNTADQDTVRAGDILIVPMTTPDFLPSLQKAAAFVTDEGGVICHAAIIARELKKPCVIGTKKATSVFRNGDWVEVNGFTGVVRVVPRPE